MNPKEILQLSLELAKERKGFTSPNPSVGAVIVRGDEVLAKGYHWASGHPHAEIEAFRNAQEQDKEVSGATLVVSLEPCCHFGKTPPCTDAIIERRIKKVIYGFEDPNFVVKGKGVEKLQAAGIEVEKIELQEVDTFYRTYRHWVQNQKSWLTGKLAITSEGFTAGLGKERLLISGKEAHHYTHTRRKFADAILTSWKTVEKDNPLLTSRLDKEIPKPVFVLDKNLDFQASYLLGNNPERVTLLHLANVNLEKKKWLESQGFKCVSVPEKKENIDLSCLPALFGKKGFHEVWIEVGVTLFNEFIKDQLFQEVVIYESKNSKPGKNPFDKQTLSSDSYELEKVQEWKTDFQCIYLQKG